MNEIVVTPKGSVIETALPHPGDSRLVSCYPTARPGFHGAYCFRQASIVAELEQPVQMVWHNDKGKRFGQA
ncbi:MAG: hypothetical protein WB812_02945 [Woeseiaceae bacterium]